MALLAPRQCAICEKPLEEGQSVIILRRGRISLNSKRLKRKHWHFDEHDKYEPKLEVHQESTRLKAAHEGCLEL